MAIGGQVVFNEEFPDPAEQAEVLLEICQGDICEAQAIVVTNLKYANCHTDRVYWLRVEALISNQYQAMVMGKGTSVEHSGGEE
jgi:hypothetical protein